MGDSEGSSSEGLEFRILGPLEVLRDGEVLPLGGAKQRAVLAILLIGRGRAVSTDTLIDGLWGESPPPTASKALQVHVSNLRKVLGGEALVTKPGGYELIASGAQVDADRFERLAREGHEAAEKGDHPAAARLLTDALAEWRGEPLADFAYEDFARAEAERLSDAKLEATEDRFAAELNLGRHKRVVSDLEALAAEQPTRERLHELTMLALYRSGRQADALEHYAAHRRRLVEELGIEPGPSLQALQMKILEQDPDLEGPPASSSFISVLEQRFGRGPSLIAGGGLLLLGVAIGAFLLSGSDEPEPAEANTVIAIDPSSGKRVDEIPVGARPGPIAADEGGIWVANLDDDSISQIDTGTNSVKGTTPLDTSVDGLAAGLGGVWTMDIQRSVVSKLDPASRTLAEKIDVAVPATEGGEAPLRLGHTSGPVATGENGVWVGNARAAIIRIDPETDEVAGRTDVGNDPAAIAVGEGSVWVADEEDSTVARIDPASAAAVTQTIPVGQGPSAIAVGEGGVWVANTRDDTVTHIDPDSGSAQATIAVGSRPTGIAAGGGSVWVANSLDGTVSRIDPGSNQVAETLAVGQQPEGVVYAEDRLWVSVQAAPVEEEAPAAETADAELRVLLSQDPGPTDPALYFSNSQAAHATCATLMSYPDEPAPEGGTLAPEVAADFPEVSDDGLTYTFTIREGFRFSPPSEEPVTAESFKRAIERTLDPRLQSLASFFMQDIAGAPEYAKGKAKTLEGVEANGDTLTITLSRPGPDLPARLATPWFCAIPPDTPVKQQGVPVIPSAGPYYVDSYEPGKALVLLRNPNYGGEREAGFAEIDYDLAVPPERAVKEVEAGDADVYGNSVIGSFIPTPDLERLDSLYGAGSEAAGQGRQQLFEAQAPTVYFLAFNTARPTFADADVRQAVSFAIDRPSLSREPFPGATGLPTDQYLPPGTPGYADADIYPLSGPDIGRAKELAGSKKRSATFYTCNLPPCAATAQILKSNLAEIGIDLETRQFPIPVLFERLLAPNEPFDIAQVGYAADYADPADFINNLFQVGAVIPPLGDPQFDERMDAAALLTGDERLTEYASLDAELTAEGAPAAAYASGTYTTLYSERVDCQVEQPIYGTVLGRLCLRD